MEETQQFVPSDPLIISFRGLLPHAMMGNRDAAYLNA